MGITAKRMGLLKKMLKKIENERLNNEKQARRSSSKKNDKNN